MNWDAATDAKLFAAIVRVNNVTLGGGIAERLAKMMGPGCNAKAVVNRMTSIRKRGMELNDDVDDGGDVPKAKKTKTKGVKAGGKSSKSGKGGKKAKEVEASDVEDDEQNSRPAKRAKRDSKIEQKDGIEVGEDVGEGLRSVVKAKEEEDDDVDYV